MSPDGTNLAVVDFKRGAKMPEAIVYAKGVESKPDLTWGHWIVTDEPVIDPVTGNATECRKKITVAPQNSLSLQIHEGREELYTGLDGVSKVCVNGEIFDLAEGDEVFLPRGCLHFSWNEGEVPSVFREIQSGKNCDENDIKRACDRLKPAHMLHSDEEIIKMMIDVCKDRYDAGERPNYDSGSNNPHMKRIADADLLNIYINHKDGRLNYEMNKVLQKCKDLHSKRTPKPKSKHKPSVVAAK